MVKDSNSHIRNRYMDDQKAMLLRDVFGESSDDENDRDADDYAHVDSSLSMESPLEKPDGLNPNWTRIDDVPGLWICQDFISAEEQASLLSEIERGIYAVFYLLTIFGIGTELGSWKQCNDNKAYFRFLTCFGCRRMASGNFR